MYHSLSILACSSYTCVYVGSLYALPRLFAWCRKRPLEKHRYRDNPHVIIERLASACTATIINLIATATLLRRCDVLPEQQPFRTLHALRLLGLPMPEPTFLTSQFFPFNPSIGVFLGRIGWICAQSLMLTSCLYIGTFFAKLLDHLSSQRELKSLEPRDTWLQCLRNYIIVCTRLMRMLTCRVRAQRNWYFVHVC